MHRGRREVSLHLGIITVHDGDLGLLQNNYEKEKKAGDIAQSAKHLLGMCKAPVQPPGLKKKGRIIINDVLHSKTP